MNRLTRQQRAVAARRKQGDATLAAFAECIAEGMTVTDAAKAIGVRRQYGSRLMKRLAEEMGG